MNRIIDYIIEQRKGHYCHALELSNVYELQSTIDAIYDEFIEHYYKEEIIDFFNTISLYYYTEEEENKEEEEELYNFDIEYYINNI